MKLIITDLEEFNIPVEGEHKLIKSKDGIRHCIGCFGCWVKTPGKCVIHDGYEGTGIDMSKCSEMILVSKCCYGGPSPLVKMVLDRAISYVHPDFVISKGEMHHKRRYTNVITLSAYYYGEDITAAEKETASRLLEANADNFEGMVKEVRFYNTIQELEGLTL